MGGTSSFYTKPGTAYAGATSYGVDARPALLFRHNPRGRMAIDEQTAQLLRACQRSGQMPTTSYQARRLYREQTGFCPWRSPSRGASRDGRISQQADDEFLYSTQVDDTQPVSISDENPSPAEVARALDENERRMQNRDTGAIQGYPSLSPSRQPSAASRRRDSTRSLTREPSTEPKEEGPEHISQAQARARIIAQIAALHPATESAIEDVFRNARKELSEPNTTLTKAEVSRIISQVRRDLCLPAPQPEPAARKSRGMTQERIDELCYSRMRAIQPYAQGRTQTLSSSGTQPTRTQQTQSVGQTRTQQQLEPVPESPEDTGHSQTPMEYSVPPEDSDRCDVPDDTPDVSVTQDEGLAVDEPEPEPALVPIEEEPEYPPFDPPACGQDGSLSSADLDVPRSELLSSIDIDIEEDAVQSQPQLEVPQPEPEPVSDVLPEYPPPPQSRGREGSLATDTSDLGIGSDVRLSDFEQPEPVFLANGADATLVSSGFTQPLAAPAPREDADSFIMDDSGDSFIMDDDIE